MVSPKTTRYKDTQKAHSILDLYNDTEGKAELLQGAERTAIKYLKADEEEWLETLVAEGVYEGIATGYPGIDNILGSFVPGELLTLGGDTGHGKSLLAMNIAQNVYEKEQKPVLLVNLELTESQARKRFYELSGESRDYAGIIIQSAPMVTYQDIDVLMKKAKEEGACLVIIDHLHFFNDSIGDNAASALTRIMKHFKECAVMNEMPVMLLSHVTPTTRIDRDGNITTLKPDLHSFKGSRSIEQISDMVCFVFRQDDDSNNVEFYLRKNRSRKKIKESVYLKQEGWKLKEPQPWVPRNLVQN